jgi:hypothetical protein
MSSICELVEREDDCRCIANIWNGGKGGRCTRDIWETGYDYCTQHEEKHMMQSEGGVLREGKAYGLYFGNIYDSNLEDMVQWAKNLTKAKAERTRQRKMLKLG